MKWPIELSLFRHLQSSYNILRAQKEKDEEYQQFLKAYKRDKHSQRTRDLADRVNQRFAMNISDSDTPGTEEGMRQTIEVGKRLSYGDIIKVPDVILVSPYKRTKKTFELLKKGWSALAKVKNVKYDEKLREQEHGLSLLYNDKKVFFVKHPEQEKLFKLLGSYRYQYPQGESAVNVRQRMHQVIDSIVRNYAGKRVMIISHHLAILSLMAELEQWDDAKFFEMDSKNNAPRNSSITIYKGYPDEGQDGHLKRANYNLVLYK